MNNKTTETGPSSENNEALRNAKSAQNIDKKLWNEKACKLVPYIPGEQPQYKCIKLNTNENPYPPSPGVVEALKAFNPAILKKYPDPTSGVLRQTMSGYFGLSPDRIFLGNGSDEVLALAFQAFFGPDRPVAFADITYSFYPVFAQSYEIPYTIFPLNDDFTMPLKEFMKFDGAVVLPNPNAPTGICIEENDMRKLLLSNPNRLVLVEETYIDFGGTSIVPMLEEFDNLLIIQTLSKSRSLAGLRVGYALGSPSLIKALETVRDTFNSYTMDSIAQSLANAAFLDGEWFEQTRAAIIRTREELMRRLNEYGFRTLPSEANFVFTTHPDFPAQKLYEGLREKGIIVRYFKKSRIDNYLRITVGMPEETEILCNALGQLTKKVK